MFSTFGMTTLLGGTGGGKSHKHSLTTSSLLRFVQEMEKYEELLVESKRTINKWEHEFQKTNGRKPSKVHCKYFLMCDLKFYCSNITGGFQNCPL